MKLTGVLGFTLLTGNLIDLCFQKFSFEEKLTNYDKPIKRWQKELVRIFFAIVISLFKEFY